MSKIGIDHEGLTQFELLRKLSEYHRRNFSRLFINSKENEEIQQEFYRLLVIAGLSQGFINFIFNGLETTLRCDGEKVVFSAQNL